MDNGVADIGFMGFRSDQDAPSIATARPCEDKLVILTMKQNFEGCNRAEYRRLIRVVTVHCGDGMAKMA